MGLLRRSRTYHLDRPATTAERQRRWQQRHTAEVRRLREQVKQKVYHASLRTEVGTPWDVFDPYNDEFGFSLDVCATATNRKCACFFSRTDNGLLQAWGREICWMNPPYGREIGLWMAKAYQSSLAGATVVCLVPARTDTQWWHAWVLGKGEVRFRKGRVHFDGYADPAGFPCLAVIYRPPTP
jgi:phage N-6-adenine-methyltransferase